MTSTNFHHFDRDFASAFLSLKAIPKRQGEGLGYVVHFAAGSGVWLSAAAQLGASKLMGLDSKPTDASALCVPPETILEVDLSKVRVNLPEQADLAICLDFAHLLDPACNEHFVEDLCRAGARVLFAAPVPFQLRGLGFHLRWPSYWARLFAAHGYHPDLRFRQQVWSNGAIEPAIRQNCLLYTKRDKGYRARTPLENLDVVHPAFFLEFSHRQDWLAKQLTKSTISRLNRKTNK